MSSQIIIRVNDLDSCRYFYRQVLGLGEPYCDTTFGCCFNLDENLILILQKCALPYLEHASSATTWGFFCSDPEALVQRMQQNDTPLGDIEECFGRKCYRCIDPEGNCFFAILS